MDEMKLKLSTYLMKTLIAKFVRKIIKKKYKCDLNISINDLDVELKNQKANIHLNVDACISQDDLMYILGVISEDS